jgi:hypothetical protein
MKVLLICFALLEIANCFMHPFTIRRMQSSCKTISLMHQHDIDEEEKPILKNTHSYYNTNKVISNETSEILKIYTTYNHKYSIVVHKCGKIDHHFNQTLKLKCSEDIIQLNIVSMRHFRKLYEDLCLPNKDDIRLIFDITKNEGN